MKKRNVRILILVAFVLTMIIIFTNKVYAVEPTKMDINIGEKKTFTFSDLSENGIVPKKITSASADNEHIAVEEVETRFLFWKTIGEIKVSGVSEGNTILTIYYQYDKTIMGPNGGQPQTMTNTGFKQYNIKVIDKEKQIKEEVDELEFREDIENNKMEKWEEDYKKDVNVVDEEGPTYKRDYLQSILYQDKKNGNKDLWNKFVKETTPEQRYNWYRAIIPLRDETNGIQEAKNALKAQIDLDKGNITQEEADKTLDNARKCSTKCIYSITKKC